MDCTKLGFPVLHYLPEFAQSDVRCVSDAIQPSHPVTPFSSCPQSFPESGSFPVSQLFASGGQRFGVSASASVLPMNIQCWFHLRLTGLISLQSKGLSRVFSSTNSANSHRTTQIIFHVGWVAILSFWGSRSCLMMVLIFFYILDDFLLSCSVVEKRSSKSLNCNCEFVHLIF